MTIEDTITKQILEAKLTPLDLYQLEQARQQGNSAKANQILISPERKDPKHWLYGTAGPLDARIMIVGESYGEKEKKRKQPFVGATGEVLNDILAETLPTELLPLREPIVRKDCFITNVVPVHPSGNKMYRLFHSNASAHA